MSGFLPDLATWALGGGAGGTRTGDSSSTVEENTENSTQNPAETMSAEDLRSQRLARLELMQWRQQEQNATSAQAQPMDIDDDDSKPAAKESLPPTTGTEPKSPPTSSIVKSAPVSTHSISSPTTIQEIQQNPKKVKSEKDSPMDQARMRNRRMETLLKKVLQIVLEGSHLSSIQDNTSTSIGVTATIIDTGSSEISTQSIAEILAVRLSAESPAKSGLPVQSLLSYLAASHRRASEEVKTIQQSDQSLKKSKISQFVEESTQLMQEIQRQVVSYAATCLLEPDLFETAKDSTTQLAKCLLFGTGTQSSDPTENTSITFGVSGTANSSFYHLLVDELKQQDSDALETRIVPALVEFFMNILKGCESILDHGSGPDAASPAVVVSAVTAMCSHKTIAQFVANSSYFLLPTAESPQAKETIWPRSNTANSSVHLFQLLASNNADSRPYLKRSGPALEKNTILGLCLRIGTPNSRNPITSNNPAFSPSTILRQSLNAVESETSQQRSQLRVVQTACYQLVMTFIKAGPAIREKVLQWIQDALIVNVGASAMRPDASKLSSPNLLLNMLILLLKLCEPFVDDDKKQLLIDPGFLSSPSDHGGVFATTGDDAVARLGGEGDEESLSAVSPYKPKNAFIPVCFFYCARCLHLSLAPLIAQHEILLRHISHLHYQITSSNRDLQSEPRFAMLIARHRSEEVSLYQDDMIVDTLRFCNLVSKVVYNIEDDNVLKTIPEDLVSDSCNIIISMAKLQPNLMRGVDFRYTFKLIVKLLAAKYSTLVRNYNLRATLGDVLYELFLPVSVGERREVPSSVSSDPAAGGKTFLLSDLAAQETLAPSLLLLYGEVEHTGYYDKMSHRAKIASVIKYLWESSEHRQAFRRITQNKESFIKFANGIINETNTLIATVMQKLPEIREAQQRMKNIQEWSTLSEDEQAQVSSRLEDNESEVKHALPLCNKTLQMFGYLNTDPDIRGLFLLDELCTRLVTMLLHVLTKLVGSKGLDLKVDNPDQYEFRPKEMLRDLCAIFALFSSSQTFQDECAKSGCDPALLRTAVKTCRKLTLLTGDSMIAFESLPETVNAAAGRVAADEDLLKDAPDEFLDEILSTFMKDPVVLPSGHFVDRTTISQHLLNDPIDPFNRLPMTIDDIRPATELKQRMDAWLEGKKSAPSTSGN